MKEQKFDFNALWNYKPTMKVVVTRKNQPNLDKVAEVIHEMLKK
jgi:hypothetical protein